jgi:hypothetical protein
MSLENQLAWIKEMNKSAARDQLMKELSETFDAVAKAAESVSDTDTKVALKVAAATGKEKIRQLRGNL